MSAEPSIGTQTPERAAVQDNMLPKMELTKWPKIRDAKHGELGDDLEIILD